MLPVEKPRWPLTGLLQRTDQGSTPRFQAGICQKAAARRRITHAGRAQVVREPEGPSEGRKDTVTPVARRQFAFRPGRRRGKHVLPDGRFSPPILRRADAVPRLSADEA
jgi:hypothetical protein